MFRDRLKRFRLPILLTGALLGLGIGHFISPTWIYSDLIEIWEIGDELVGYRSAHAAMVLGFTVSFFTLVAARLVGLGILSTVLTSMLTVFLFNIIQRVRVANMIDASMLLAEAKFIPIFLFGAFTVVGIWYFIASIKGHANGKGNT